MSWTLFLTLVLLGAAVFILSQVLIVPTFGTDAKARRLLRRRLQEIGANDPDSEVTSLLRKKYLRELSPVERTLEQLPFMDALGRYIEQSGHSILAHRLVLLSVLLAALAFVAALVVARNPVIAVLAMSLVALVPYIYVYRERRERLARFEEQLPDALDVMKRALRAGHPFSAAIKLVAEDMDDPLAKEFELTFADINFGNDTRRALLGLLMRVPSTNLMAIVTAVLIQKETGGNLADVFERIAQVIRGRFKFGRRVRTLSAEGRLSAWILALIPFVLAAVLWFIAPDYLPPLLESPSGRKLIVFACAMMFAGVLWMRRIIRIDF
jgi:tight adherence protein B